VGRLQWFGVVELEGKYLRSRNKVDGMGQKSGRNGAPSPAKPSKPLRTEAKRVVLPLGVRTEFLAGCSPIRSRLSSTGLRSRAYLSARYARAANPSRILSLSTTSKKLRTHSKRENYSLGFSSERLTRLCGAGAPFRPLFCPIPSYFVPGPRYFPSNSTTPNHLEPPHSGKNLP